jgi:hypothetical protein
MASYQLPPLSFEKDDGLPILLIPASDDQPSGSIRNAAMSAPVSSINTDNEPTTHLTIPPRSMRRKPAAPRPNSNTLDVPEHPMPSMQDAFAESYMEAYIGDPDGKPKLRTGDAKSRRQALIAQEKDAAPYGVEWRFRPGQKQHEIWKLVAQVSFGIYLLLSGMANSNEQVADILQKHIDEVDEFLEVTMEDFKEASTDLNERIDFLRLPMENMDVFERMLEDRSFRLEIIAANETIEHILSRSNAALKQSETDIQVGLKATKEFSKYLSGVKVGTWKNDGEVSEIFDAMKLNTEGWFNTFVKLQKEGKELTALITKLGSVVSQMDRKAGEVSRRTWVWLNLPL